MALTRNPGSTLAGNSYTPIGDVHPQSSRYTLKLRPPTRECQLVQHFIRGCLLSHILLVEIQSVLCFMIAERYVVL